MKLRLAQDPFFCFFSDLRRQAAVVFLALGITLADFLGKCTIKLLSALRDNVLVK